MICLYIYLYYKLLKIKMDDKIIEINLEEKIKEDKRNKFNMKKGF